MRAEPLNLFDQGSEQALWGQVAALPEGFRQALFAKFFSRFVERIAADLRSQRVSRLVTRQREQENDIPHEAGCNELRIHR